MAKILMCTDGREFILITCAYTPEQKDALEVGMFDGCYEYELVGELPQIRSSKTYGPNGLDDDQRFTLFVKGFGSPKAQAKVKLGYENQPETDEDGFTQGASGSDEELFSSPVELIGLVEDALAHADDRNE